MIFDFLILGGDTPRTDRHRLAGIITVDGMPAKRQVVVLSRETMMLVASAVSDAISGEWEIKGISEYPERQLIVLALDSTGTYNAEIADYVSQVATA